MVVPENIDWTIAFCSLKVFPFALSSCKSAPVEKDIKTSKVYIVFNLSSNSRSVVILLVYSRFNKSVGYNA